VFFLQLYIKIMKFCCMFDSWYKFLGVKYLEKVKQAARGEFATLRIIGAANWLLQDNLQCCAANSIFGDFGGKGSHQLSKWIHTNTLRVFYALGFHLLQENSLVWTHHQLLKNVAYVVNILL
jgi:hypothetical protein